MEIVSYTVNTFYNKSSQEDYEIQSIWVDSILGHVQSENEYDLYVHFPFVHDQVERWTDS